MQEDRPIWALLGPSASQKSALAVTLAEAHPELNLGLVSLDSVMLYRELNIGSAKPGPDILSRIPHAMVNIASILEPYNLARFVRECKEAIESLRAQGKTPFLVGGTMLYAKALKEGLDGQPASEAALVQKARELMEAQGRETFLSALKTRNPDLNLHPNDTHRLIRAFCLQSQSESESPNPREAGLPLRFILNAPENRHELDLAVQARTEMMIQEGLVEEVEDILKMLQTQGIPPESLPPLRSIGYKETLAHLNGTLTPPLNEAINHATRQFIKRQYTWMKRFKWEETLSPNESLTQRAEKLFSILQKPLAF